MPSYEEVYEPPMLDETGQDVAAAIRELKGVVQPTNVCVDLDVSLEVSGWSNSAPYVYNWMNNKVTTECAVKVNYLEGAEDTDELYIGYEKIVGGIQFESPTKPTAAIPVRIHIVNAEADSINNVTDEMVSSNVISGAANVKQALTSLKNADASLSEQIGTLNSNLMKYHSAEITESTGNSVDISKLTGKIYFVIGTYSTGGLVFFGMLTKRNGSFNNMQTIFIRNEFIAVSQSGTTITFTAGSGFGASYFDFIPLC